MRLLELAALLGASGWLLWKLPLWVDEERKQHWRQREADEHLRR